MANSINARPIQNEEFSKVTDLVYQKNADATIKTNTKPVVNMRLVLRKYCLTSAGVLVISSIACVQRLIAKLSN